MKVKKGKNRDVLIGELANMIPLDAWFTADEFCVFTGILKASAVQRLVSLKKAGFVEKRVLKHRSSFFFTAEMRKAMKKKARENKRRKGKALPTKEEIIDAEKVAELNKLCISTAWV